MMLWGLGPDGIGDFSKVVGVDHMIRPFEMERVTLPGVRDPILSGLTMRDVVMESGAKMFGWAGDRFAANDVFTSVVDVGDVAPFATLPDGTHWGYDDAKPGWDHWPRNMFNGFLFADSWKYAFTLVTSRSPTATKWTMTYPVPQTFTELSILLTPIFAQVNTINLYFDDDPTPTALTVAKNWEENQIFPLSPPRTAKVVAVELADYQRTPTGGATIGIDNMWLHVQRSTEFQKKVRPLLNIGALVKYQMGTGGIILNNLQVQPKESNPTNAQKKQAIVATLLRNLGAPFSGGKVVVAGAGMTYTPVELGDKCNTFLTRDKGWFDNRDLAAFPKGEQKLTGVTYLIRDFKTSPLPACIMLAGPGAPANLARGVTGIPVGHRADALFFLHTFKRTQDWQPPREGDRTPPALFRYVVHYEDGQTADLPVRYGEDADHWISREPRGLKNAAVAWAAPFAADASGDHAVVYQYQWTNPRPGVPVTAVDLAYDSSTDGRHGIPVLLGLSVGNTTERAQPKE